MDETLNMMSNPAYDCEFAVLAQYLDVPLITGDRQMLDQIPTCAVSLEGFVT
jgi:predicted nucleic acid-binding protein